MYPIRIRIQDIASSRILKICLVIFVLGFYFKEVVYHSLQSEPAENGVKNSAPSVIPRRIHQMYASDRVPLVYVPYMRSWVREHPDWEYWFWSDDDILNLLTERYPQYVTQFREYKYNLQRADMARYLILDTFGGVYADADYYCLKPLDQYLAGNSCVLAQEPEEQTYLLYSKTVVMTNAFMASTPRHPFLVRLIQSLRDTYLQKTDNYDKPGTPIHTTGPIFLQEVLENYQRRQMLSCRGETSCMIFRAPSQDLCPSIDSGKVVKFKKTCDDLERLMKLASPRMVSKFPRKLVEVCDSLERSGYVMNYTGAYATHAWIHAGYSLFDLRRRFTESLTKIFDRGTKIHRFRKTNIS